MTNRLSLSGGLAFEDSTFEFKEFRLHTTYLSLLGQAQYKFIDALFDLYSYRRLGYGYSYNGDTNINSHKDDPNLQIGLGVMLCLW
jgi:hypothetical protein